jgi:hypothetical protein
MFGDGLEVLGFAFIRGGFQALNFSNVPTGELQAFTVGPTQAGGFDSVLADAVAPIAAVPLRAVPPSGPAAEWFRSAPLTHDLGSSYTEASRDNYFLNAPANRSVCQLDSIWPTLIISFGSLKALWFPCLLSVLGDPGRSGALRCAFCGALNAAAKDALQKSE